MQDRNAFKESGATPRYPGWCSFCRMSYKDVGPLAEGPDQVYICYQCTQLCANLIAGERGSKSAGLTEESKEAAGPTFPFTHADVFFSGKCSARTTSTIISGVLLTLCSIALLGAVISTFSLHSPFLVGVIITSAIIVGIFGIILLLEWATSKETQLEINKSGIRYGGTDVPWDRVLTLSPLYINSRIVCLLVRARKTFGFTGPGQALFVDETIDADKWRQVAEKVRSYLASIECNAMIKV